ncbi:MAG: flagellar hook-associated protein FlgL, partial [Planctomycetes bacterium]|nr:flagellar hook-associated protein FlgL [Planctomycetota bacterium]
MLRHLQASYSRMSKLQNQITTGKRLIRPSDDPSDAGIIMRNKSEDARLQTYLSTIRDTSSVLEG